MRSGHPRSNRGPKCFAYKTKLCLVRAVSFMFLLSTSLTQLADQDDQLHLIGQGVSNLKQYSLAVKNEADLHVRLLDDINIEVDRATTGLESEGDRAQVLAKKSSNFRLYLAIVVLSAILVRMMTITAAAAFAAAAVIAAPPAAGATVCLAESPFGQALRTLQEHPWTSAALGRLQFDRQWLIVDGNNDFVTQRKVPKMALICPILTPFDPSTLAASPCPAQSITLTATDHAMKPLVVPVLSHGVERNVRVWKDRVDAIDQGDEAAAWVATFLGHPSYRLVRLKDSFKRPCDPAFAPDHETGTDRSEQTHAER
ncbi:hypothetical protein DYB32_002146 [Aphanomyces invadans]|uniref:t-SNARE coiled-coil homology domain-containing protein n=1 Tax=Aphanomyces invadans TaxID=157072 RepID=A0A418B460_9STRA|nr:hypothetical protein DYB32_002146 [Aphanomyces invadans]